MLRYPRRFFHGTIALNGVGTYDENNCLDLANVELSDFLVSTLVELCDCVPKQSHNAFYNPATMAVTAMLVPNLLCMALLVAKYAKFYIQKLPRCLSPTTEDDVELLTKNDVFIARLSVPISVLSFILNTAVGLSSLVGYFTSPDLAPYGNGLCHAAHVTFAVMYKPALISFFGAVVAGCDVVYWRFIESKPPVMRQAMGHMDHPEEPPLDENYITFSCILVVALVYLAWASVSLTFLPLAGLFIPVVLVFGLSLPVVLLYGVGELLERFEAVLDGSISEEEGEALQEEPLEATSSLPSKNNAPKGGPEHNKGAKLGGPVKVKKGFIVKAVLAQLVSTVVLVATTATFYVDGDWPSSVENTAVLARALINAFSFDLEYSFGWPELPRFAMINFSLAVGVLAFQFFVTNFVRLYYGTGANQFGTTKISNQAEENEGFIARTYAVLNSALATAIAIDGFVLRREASKRFQKAKKSFERRIDSAPTESSPQMKKVKEKIAEMHADLNHHRRVVKAETRKVEMVGSDLDRYEHYYSTRVLTKIDLGHEFFVNQLEYLVSAGGGRTLESIHDLSLASTELHVRDGIAVFLLNEPCADTNRLIHALFSKFVLPELRQLRLDKIVDIDTIDRDACLGLMKALSQNPHLTILLDENIKGSKSLELPNNVDQVISKKTDLSWAAPLKADIGGMQTWRNVESLFLDGCEHFVGDISFLKHWPEGRFKVAHFKGCSALKGNIEVIQKFRLLEEANFSGCNNIEGRLFHNFHEPPDQSSGMFLPR
jgi:hypothetical protein